MTRVAVATPVFRLLADFFAIFQQRIFNIHGRTQRRLVDARVIDLHVNADRRAAVERARNVRNHFHVSDGEHAYGRLIAERFQLIRNHQR